MATKKPSSEVTVGIKYDDKKLDFSLLSPYAMIKLTQVLTYGKFKYDANNWRKGIVYTRLIAATFRHLYLWLAGADIDKDSATEEHEGLSHLACAMCSIMFLLEFSQTSQHLDDRFKFKEGHLNEMTNLMVSKEAE